MPKGIYANNNPKYRKVNMKVKQSGPVIMREKGYDIVKAITVFIAKECGYKRISTSLMYFTVEVLCDMCQEGYEDRSGGHFQPDYVAGIDNYFEELARKVISKFRR